MLKPSRRSPRGESPDLSGTTRLQELLLRANSCQFVVSLHVTFGTPRICLLSPVSPPSVLAYLTKPINQPAPFAQNKPNFKKAGIAATSFITKGYTKMPLRPPRKNKPKQTQRPKGVLSIVEGSNPILSLRDAPALNFGPCSLAGASPLQTTQ